MKFSQFVACCVEGFLAGILLLMGSALGYTLIVDVTAGGLIVWVNVLMLVAVFGGAWALLKPAGAKLWDFVRGAHLPSPNVDIYPNSYPPDEDELRRRYGGTR